MVFQAGGGDHLGKRPRVQAGLGFASASLEGSCALSCHLLLTRGRSPQRAPTGPVLTGPVLTRRHPPPPLPALLPWLPPVRQRRQAEETRVSLPTLPGPRPSRLLPAVPLAYFRSMFRRRLLIGTAWHLDGPLSWSKSPLCLMFKRMCLAAPFPPNSLLFLLV